MTSRKNAFTILKAGIITSEYQVITVTSYLLAENRKVENNGFCKLCMDDGRDCYLN
jgi:hypothetical protein